MSFDSLGLAPALLSAIRKAGFTTPTDVQSASIPQAMQGHDLMVSAQTGSGKTAAFMLPALHRIAGMPAGKGRGVQILVLTPTRELAMQITEATRVYGAHLSDLRTATVVGGVPYGAQLKALSRRVDVLVATPGRLIDHLQSGRVKLSTVHTLVLDEADRMLDMGFIEDIETIVSHTPAERQTMLFSATLDGTVARLAARMMREPVRIDVSGHHQKHANITQNLLYADDDSHKQRLLDHLLRDADLNQAIVFTATKRGADDLADRLADQGFQAAALHGDMNQRQRTRTLSRLQKHQLRILVATDVAARGIDVQGISHAINYDLPMQPEDYTHRIGRTGRAGHDGQAFTLATVNERHKIRRIEHYIGQPIPLLTIEGLEPRKSVRPTYVDRKNAPRRGDHAGHGRPGGKPGFGKPGFGKPGFGKPGFGHPTRKASDEHASFTPRTRSYADENAERGHRPAGRPEFREERRAEPRGDHRDLAGSPGARKSAGRFDDRPARPERPAFGKHARADKPNAVWSRAERPSSGRKPAAKAGAKPAHHAARRPSF